MSIWTPNASDLLDEQSAAVALRVGLEHMQYLTYETCAFIARKLGLQPVHVESLGFPGLDGIERAATQVAPRSTGIRAGFIRMLKDNVRRTSLVRSGVEIRDKIRSAANRNGVYHLHAAIPSGSRR